MTPRDRTESAPTEWTVRQLGDSLSRNEPFFLLDVGNRDEFEAIRIEGRAPIQTRNVPYFEMLDDAGDDLVASIEKYVTSTLTGELPKTMPLLTVCAKGGRHQAHQRGAARGR